MTLELNLEEDRYSRLKLITWWDQEKLKRSKVMVVGAGAIGNELVKNLALLGVGNIFILDMDKIELSNLARSVLFRAEDMGKYKCEVAAQRAMEINPDIKAVGLIANVVSDIGLGLFKEMDVVLGGLDNREARLHINQCCWKVNVPWIDGAIEVLHGIARVFIPPDSACYECTMSELDYELLNKRKSCALLTKSDLLEGKVPTTSTTSSIIAGIQVQEAIKLIHDRPDLPTLKGQGFQFNGLTHDSYLVNYQRKEDCLSHDTFEEIILLERSVRDITIKEMLDLIREDLGKDAIIDLGHEIVLELQCGNCHKSEFVYRPISKINTRVAECPDCKEVRTPIMCHSLNGNEPFIQKTLYEIGIPLYDIVTGRNGINRKHYLFMKDRWEAMHGLV
jgi:adenylyltransferase/sulfurtransferase